VPDASTTERPSARVSPTPAAVEQHVRDGVLVGHPDEHHVGGLGGVGGQMCRTDARGHRLRDPTGVAVVRRDVEPELDESARDREAGGAEAHDAHVPDLHDGRSCPFRFPTCRRDRRGG
jgi:hypothetical protein